MSSEIFEAVATKELQTNKTNPATGAWTTSNVSTDRSIDADGLIAVIGDGLCTLIEDLKTKGILE